MTSRAHAGGRISRSLRAVDGSGVVRVQDRVDTSIDTVWSALTEPPRLARWLGRVDGDLRPGGQLRARLFASGWEGTGRLEVCEAPQRLLVRTRDADASAEQAVEVRLSADGDATTVVWEERGMPVDLLAAYGAGVQIQVEDLASYLAGRDRCDAEARFGELLPAYAELAVNVG